MKKKSYRRYSARSESLRMCLHNVDFMVGLIMIISVILIAVFAP